MRETDQAILDLLGREPSMSIVQFQEALQVTPTAVRHRLTRLLDRGMIQRTSEPAEGRGRPGHRYRLTDLGRRQGGSNFIDLATILWAEIRSVNQLEVRRGLLTRIAGRLADVYRSRIPAGSLRQRMEAVAALFRERNIPFEVDTQGSLPVLRALACPYSGLAEEDRSVCSMERMMISDLLGQRVTLDGCRLDGQTCCTFRPSEIADGKPALATQTREEIA